MGAAVVGTAAPLSEDQLEVLVPAAARGDAEAWASLTDRFARLLWAVARSYRLNDADAADVVQNTWLRLLDNLAKIECPRALPGWLRTTARREAIAVIRRRRDVLTDMTDDRIDHSDDGDRHDLDLMLLKDERDVQLWAAFGRLPQRDQRLLLLVVASDSCVYADAAVILDMPVGSIGPTRARALAKLRKMLADGGYPFDH